MAVKFQYNEEAHNSNYPLYDNNWVSQSFSEPIVSYDLTTVQLKMHRAGSGGNVTVSIRATDGADAPTGADLCVSSAVDCSAITVSTTGEWVVFTFTTTFSAVAGTTYAICARGDSVIADAIRWETDTSSPSYANGQTATSANAGTDWTTTAYDAIFRVYGNATTTPVDKTYSKQLVALAGNEIWYETSAGTMGELSAANADFNCVLPLQATEAYQKIFIANKTNKKIVDFVNTKINTDDAGAVACTPGVVLTGGSSTASMIVDYVDGVTDDAEANIYGYRTTAATFSSGETVTGTGSISFVTSAAETAPPHWYNWTVFGNDTTTYGTMLTEATLVCLYRGRLVISGDSTKPHAWQMTKVGNPWKVLYDYSNDGDLSAIAYSNNKVGEIGDIPTALIPYKDDLLIFGCANSVWLLVGDPLAEGQLAEITQSTGVWGAQAWCIDNAKNLYFLGSDGIYKMQVSETSAPPTNISKIKLPNLVADLGLDKGLHRVVLAFDPVENGIIITRTLLSDGTNTGYFFSLLTEGFFPESYHANCGIFSSYYYPATNNTYKKFLVGCADGYIREFDAATKNNATTSSTSAINSYCTILQMMGEDEFHYGMLKEFSGIVAGGGGGGDFSDTDEVSWRLYKGSDAETVLEKMKAATAWADATVYAIGDLVTYSDLEYICIIAHTSATGAATHEEPDTNTTDWDLAAFTGGTWSTTGKQNKSRPRMRGTWMGLKLYNSTASETWGIERLYGFTIPKGRI